jgi:hypothetical protein
VLAELPFHGVAALPFDVVAALPFKSFQSFKTFKPCSMEIAITSGGDETNSRF